LDTVRLCLSGKHSLSLVTVSLAFAVLLVSVLNGDLFVHQVLTVHVGDGVIRGLEVGERDESVALGKIVFVTGNLDL
jgi:Tfp pilus assembly protein PilZ